MEFFNKVVTSISQKQASCMQSIEESAQYFLAPDPMSFFENIPRLLDRNFQNSTKEHLSKISKYLFTSSLDTLIIDRVTETVAGKQGRLVDVLEQNFGKMIQPKLDILTYQTVKRPVRTEQAQKSSNLQSQKDSSQDQKQLQKQLAQQSTAAQQANHEYNQAAKQGSKKQAKLQKPSQDNKIQYSQKKGSHHQQAAAATEIVYDRAISFQDRNNNPEHVALAASEYIPKRDIVKQLEEKRKRLAQRELKSKQLKNKLIKLEPIARKQDKELREKEAREKLFAGIEFVKNLHNNKNSVNVKVTQWRQDRLNNSEKKDNQSPKYSNRKLEPLRGHQIKGFQGLVGSRIIAESRTKRTDKIPSRIEKGQKNFTLKKPTPYNIYNVNQEKEQVFQLQYK